MIKYFLYIMKQFYEYNKIYRTYNVNNYSILTKI